MMKTMSRVTIALPPRPYDAVIENGLLQRSGETLRDLFKVIFTVNSPRKSWKCPMANATKSWPR
jgi:hypothetical protein